VRRARLSKSKTESLEKKDYAIHPAN